MRLSIELTPDQHKRLKAAAAKNGAKSAQSIDDVFDAVLKQRSSK